MYGITGNYPEVGGVLTWGRLHEAEVITADGPTSDTLQDATGRIVFRGEQK